MPDALEQLDLLLLTVAKPRTVRRDGIWFLGRRYLDTTLAAYVGESVIIRDVAEIRVFYQDRFLCRAICPELAGTTIPLLDIVRARNRHRRELRQTLQARAEVVETLLHLRQGHAAGHASASAEAAQVQTPATSSPPASTPRLKRYYNE